MHLLDCDLPLAKTPGMGEYGLKIIGLQLFQFVELV